MAGAKVFKDVPYVANHSDLQTLDLFILDSNSTPPLLVFVHGGAWASGDKSYLYTFAEHFVDKAKCAVALVNYRLTTKSNLLLHPGHCEDLIHALEFLARPSSSGDIPLEGLYDHTQIHVAGHSCGAHMLACVILDSHRVTPSLTVSSEVTSCLRSVTMSEGLHDLDLQVKTFPSHVGFMLAAFGEERDNFKDVSPVSYGSRGKDDIRWLIIHSKGDTLVKVSQSEAMYNHLSSLGARVAKNWETLDGDHDDILSTAAYASIISDFVNAS